MWSLKAGLTVFAGESSEQSITRCLVTFLIIYGWATPTTASEITEQGKSKTRKTTATEKVAFSGQVAAFTATAQLHPGHDSDTRNAPRGPDYSNIWWQIPQQYPQGSAAATGIQCRWSNSYENNVSFSSRQTIIVHTFDMPLWIIISYFK